MPVTLAEPSPPRFAFGENWSRFLRTVTEERIAAAVQSLRNVLVAQLPCPPAAAGQPGGRLSGKRFLDIGCGSGLFSLAAYRLGVQVTSFDYDLDSVRCAEELHRREHASLERWQIEQGSVFDAEYLQRCGTFDVVYSWGVLHHTGDMWTAIGLAAERVSPGGLFWISIYNDQGLTSRIWRGIKRGYVRLPRWLQPAYVILTGGSWMAWRMLLRMFQMTVSSLLRLVTGRNPLQPWRQFRTDAAASQRARGMNVWYDLVDWIGGYPFEVAKPEEVFRCLRDRGFQLVELTTCGGGLGCNEFVFRRTGT